MYNVSKTIHNTYGNVIEIIRSDDGEFKTPFDAFNKAKSLRRIWLEEPVSKVRFLIDNQILSLVQAKEWATTEYQMLPKCEHCAKLLWGTVFNHNLSCKLFCTQICADKNYLFEIERMNDNDETEFYL